MNVLFALDCSEFAYKDNETKCFGYDCDFLKNSDTDAQAYVIHEDDYKVLAFRGTSSFHDVLSDLNAFTVPYKSDKKARIHAGFLEQYQSLEPQILKALDVSGTVICTGHSLGGALSQIAAIQLKYLGYDTACIHFGSPRVGNKAFADLLTTQVPGNLAVVHKLDPVPQFPSFCGWWKHPSTKRLEISDYKMTDTFIDKNEFNFQFWRPAQAHTLKSYRDYLIKKQ